MNIQFQLARFNLGSVRAKVEGAFEGLICLASAAFVLIGTIAICFPVPALLGA